MSQAELGRRLGVDRKTVGMWERTGIVPVAHYPGIERALDVDLSMEITRSADRFSVVMTPPTDDRTMLGRLRRMRRELTLLRSELDDLIDELELRGGDATTPRPLQ